MLRSAATTEVDAVTLYAILRLRSEVFVVEQACAYLDADGRDFEPGCRQLWVEEHDTLIATARLLREAEGHRIGRVCTAPGARSRGVATAIVNGALALAGAGPIVVDAQSQLTGWYERLGFATTGCEHVEDGILHVEMVHP